MLGIIGKKLGMTQIFTEEGDLLPVTVIKVDPNLVVDLKNKEKHGYDAVVLGVSKTKKNKLNKPELGQFETRGLEPHSRLVEMRDFSHECNVGDYADVSLLESVAYVDVTGISKGKGFQGVMKRHGFHGGPARHGSKFHRAPGSTGQGANPSKIRKGTKLPGRMGGEQVTAQNLSVVRVDKANGLLIVQGAVPGTKKSELLIKASVKKTSSSFGA